MGMKTLYQEVMDLNQMEDSAPKEAAAKAFFEKLNAMEMPDYFNWAQEIFEDLHVAERGDKTALIWTDIHNKDVRQFTYREFAANGNRCLNRLRSAGVEKSA